MNLYTPGAICITASQFTPRAAATSGLPSPRLIDKVSQYAKDGVAVGLASLDIVEVG